MAGPATLVVPQEHRAVRQAAGLCDLSHMGEIMVTGPEAAAALDYALTGLLSAVAPGRARYTMMCAEDGGVLDDLVVYRTGDEEFMVVANASNTPTVLAGLQSRAAPHGGIPVFFAINDPIAWAIVPTVPTPFRYTGAVRTTQCPAAQPAHASITLSVLRRTRFPTGKRPIRLTNRFRSVWLKAGLPCSPMIDRMRAVARP